jgi:putative nucleotidyltransferase with HDIG domain
MKLEATILRSRVGRRIFILFICCALVPIGALAVLTFNRVADQLNEMGQRRLHHANRAVGVAILERLSFLEDEMKVVASRYKMNSGEISRPSTEEFGKHLKERFGCLTVITDQGKRIPLFGELQKAPQFTPQQSRHIRSGGTLVSVERDRDLTSRIFMATALGSKNQGRGILLGQLNPAYLWMASVENPFPPMTEFCILDQSNRVLFSTLPGGVSLPERVTLQMSRSASGQFEWVREKKAYVANYRSLFLEGEFSTPKWTVVLSESKSDMLSPAANFKKIFPLVILMSLFVVLLLSVVQIRRSLTPLEKLQEGTRRIAAQDFNSPVTVKSGDEFEELAASFNTMAGRLGIQFNTLTTMGKIDRAILSALETEKIIGVVLAHTPDVFACGHISVTLIHANRGITARTYAESGTVSKEIVAKEIEFSENEVQELLSHPESLLIESGEAAPGYLLPIARNGVETFLILPIILRKKLSGFITLGWSSQSTEHTQEDFGRVRQLADQMGVALSNAGLIRELSELNWGALEALARAIDAKSPWTSGHSERVTKLALKIGRSLGLTQEEMDVLHRAGLMHDIGKLGVPSEILDKQGGLTRGQTELMREHVKEGCRILEPISAYAEVVPLVLHHHEWFNGGGYPNGLAGEAISLGGRILTVADCFDALTSDRPYRQEMNRESAIELMKQGCGSQYDPDVFRAFLEVITQE